MAPNAPSHLPQPPPEVCAASAVGPDQPWELSHARPCPSLHCLQKGLSPRQPGRDRVIIHEVPTGTAGWVFNERVPPGWPSIPPPQKDIAEQWSLKGCRSPKSSHLPSSPWRWPVLLPASLAGVESGWGVGGRCGPGEGKPPHAPAATSHPHPGGSRRLRPPSRPRYPEPGEDAQSQTSPFLGLGAVVEQGS